ncbi:MAG: glycosyltransferase family protein [Planctomycetaceae bacterium]
MVRDHRAASKCRWRKPARGATIPPGASSATHDPGLRPPPAVSRIAISLCGEGRGHATRVSTLIGRLEAHHEMLVWTSADALAFLRARFAHEHPRVRIEEVPGVVFEYTGGRLDVMRSIAAGLDYQARLLGPLVDRMLSELDTFAPDLAITDFEPALPRAAGRAGIPLVSVDHQHFLLAYDLDSLPWSLQWNAWFMSHAVWMYVMEAVDTVVSAFFRPPLRRGWEHVVQVGPLLRPEILAATPRDEGFILAYLRRHTPFAAVEALADCGMPVRIYGLGDRAPVGNVSFHDVDDRMFARDLAGCRGLVSAAGNQLIGEALHLGKPLLVLPERAHSEQLMNSHFLRAMGCGEFCLLEEVERSRVREFLDGIERFAAPLAALRGRLDGTDDVLRVINRRLRGRSPAAAPAAPGPDG